MATYDLCDDCIHFLETQARDDKNPNCTVRLRTCIMGVHLNVAKHPVVECPVFGEAGEERENT